MQQDPLPKPSTSFESTNKLLVSRRQEKNPLLKHIRNVPVVFADVPSDYHISQDVGCLFLSLKFHLMQRAYIASRLDHMPGYKQKILLLVVDVGADTELMELSCLCIERNATLLACFSVLECARYIETLKLYSGRPATLIQGERAEQFEDVFAECLTTVRSVNSSDVVQLGATFGNMKGVADASLEELVLCPGLGTKKANRIRDCFDQPIK